MPKELFMRIVLVLLFLFLFFGGMVYAAPFLRPLAIALLFAFLLLPVARFLENKGAKRILSTFCCLALVLLFLGGLGGLITYQGTKFGDQYTEIKENAKESFNTITDDVSGRLGLSQDALVERIRSRSMDSAKSVIERTASGLTSTLTNALLVLVYIFCFLFYRRHFKKFFVMLFKEQKQEKVVKIMNQSIGAALLYLRGKVILIGILAVCYTAGLLLIGVKFAVFYGLFAAILSIIPFIGNIIGGGLPLLTALINGNTTMALLVIGLFTAVQVIESYVLTPLIVGKEVDLHPMMTIIVVILGASLWGIAGMIIAIPYLGIAMIILGYIPKMEPYAFLLKQENED